MDFETIFMSIIVTLFFIIPSVIWLVFIMKLKIRGRRTPFYSNICGFLTVWFLLTFFVFRIFPGANAYFSKKHIKDITGIEISAKKSFVYESFGGFQGDGYTLMSYDLKGVIPNVDLSNLRKPFTYSNKWTSYDWKKTPLVNKDRKYLNYVLSERSTKADSIRLLNVYRIINEILESDGGYYTYSCNYRSDGSWFGINFYIISIRKRLLISINSET